MTLTEHKIVATMESPKGSDEDIAALCERLSDEIEMGLVAVLDRLKIVFPGVNFMIID